MFWALPDNQGFRNLYDNLVCYLPALRQPIRNFTAQKWAVNLITYYIKARRCPAGSLKHFSNAMKTFATLIHEEILQLKHRASLIFYYIKSISAKHGSAPRQKLLVLWPPSFFYPLELFFINILC